MDIGEKNFFIVGLISIFLIIGSYFLIKKNSFSPQSIVYYSPQDEQRPKIKIEKDFYDLGKMRVSQEKQVEFVLKNEGKKPLQLFQVFTSCGCTFAKVVIDNKESEEFSMHSQSNWIGEVLPGKKAKVVAIYRPYLMPVYGLVERQIYLATNDPTNPKIVLRLQAVVN